MVPAVVFALPVAAFHIECDWAGNVVGSRNCDGVWTPVWYRTDICAPAKASRALLSDADKGFKLFGAPRVSAADMIEAIALDSGWRADAGQANTFQTRGWEVLMTLRDKLLQGWLFPRIPWHSIRIVNWMNGGNVR